MGRMRSLTVLTRIAGDPVSTTTAWSGIPRFCSVVNARVRAADVLTMKPSLLCAGSISLLTNSASPTAPSLSYHCLSFPKAYVARWTRIVSVEIRRLVSEASTPDARAARSRVVSVSKTTGVCVESR
jgi:hypothetical protein